MKFVITKNITCNDSLVCASNLISKIETKTGLVHKENKTDNAYGHVSISHVQGAHKIWIFLYDADDFHESEIKGETIKILDRKHKIKKHTGIKPTKLELEAVLD